MARAPTAWGSATGTTTPSLLLALLHLHPRWEPGAFSPTALHLRRAGPGADAAGWHAAVPGALQEAEPSAPGAAPGQQPASPSRGACTTRGVVLGSQLSSLPAPLQTHGQELQQAEVSAGCRGGEGGAVQHHPWSPQGWGRGGFTGGCRGDGEKPVVLMGYAAVTGSRLRSPAFG